jgi:hypothetical protein
MSTIGTYLMLFCLAGLLAVYVVWAFSRGRSLLSRWAEDNSFQILHSEIRTLLGGPFTLTSSRNQIVYSVRVRDRAGNEKSGWVRCGSFWFGISSDKTEVRWKDES